MLPNSVLAPLWRARRLTLTTAVAVTAATSPITHAAPEDEAAPGALSTVDRIPAPAQGSLWRPYERWDSYTGEVTLAFRDIHLPGNGGLPIELYRTYQWSDGGVRDPGFQFSHSARKKGFYSANEMVCLVSPPTGQCVCTVGACPTSVQKTGESYDLVYPETNPSTGLLKPGGRWRFAIAPEVEIQAFGSYFQSQRKWDPSTKLPVTQAVTVNALYAALCGNGTLVHGGRTVELQALIRHPAGSMEELARKGAGTLRAASNWELRCTSGTPRLQLFAPSGVRFDLGQEVAASAVTPAAHWLATKATNLRTGASYAIAYDTTDARFIRPTTITGSDGRVLTLGYDTSVSSVSRPYPAFLRPTWISALDVSLPVEPALTSATVGTSVWTYGYNGLSQDAPLLPPKGSLPSTPPARRALASLQPPGANGVWRFEYQASWNPDTPEHRSSTTTIYGDQQLRAVVEPTGGRITYQIAPDLPQYRWRPAALSTETSWEVTMGRFCLAARTIYGGNDGECSNLWVQLSQRYLASDTAARQQYRASLVRREATDPWGASSSQVTFAYTRATARDTYDVTTVKLTDVGRSRQILDDTYYHVGEAYFAPVAQSGVTAPASTNDGWRIGLLAQHVVRETPDSAPRTTTTFEWTSRAFGTGPRYVRGISWHNDDAYNAPLLARRVTTREHAAGKAVVTSTVYGDFTVFGSPQTITREGPDPTSSGDRRARVTTLTYFTDPARWLIDLPKDETTR